MPGFLQQSFRVLNAVAAAGLCLVVTALAGFGLAMALRPGPSSLSLPDVVPAVVTVIYEASPIAPLVAAAVTEATEAPTEIATSELVAEVGGEVLAAIDPGLGRVTSTVIAGAERVTAASLTPPPASDRIVFIDRDTWDTATRANIDAALSILPPAVRAQLGNPDLGPLLIMVNTEGKALSGRQPYGGATNFFSTNDGRNEVVLYIGQGVQTVLHELGHAYSLRKVPAGAYARLFLQPEMQGFMAAAGWKVLTPPEEIAKMNDHTLVQVSYSGKPILMRLSRVNPVEDYASSFAMYFAAPGDLQAQSPERFAWFQAYFGGS